MSVVRIALANLRHPASADESIALVEDAIVEASRARAAIICFPELFVPGYGVAGVRVTPIDARFLERAWTAIAGAAAEVEVVVALGTERVVEGKRRISMIVIDADGTIAGFQDKLQLDPSEETPYSPGAERRVFRAGSLTFGFAICHEGFRYPEIVRWAARHGAHVVFHPHYSWPEADAFRPTTFADPRNTFHEKAVLCRAAENTCFVASVNYASDGSPTTSVVASPDGTVLTWQPYGKEGLLVADIDTALATGLLASRLRPA